MATMFSHLLAASMRVGSGGGLLLPSLLLGTGWEMSWALSAVSDFSLLSYKSHSSKGVLSSPVSGAFLQPCG